MPVKGGAMRQEFRYGKKIQQLRDQKGWTQEHLAAVAGLEPRTIQRVEKNQTKNPETLLAIAGAFDVELSALRSTWLIPEFSLVRAELVTTHREFVTLEESYKTQIFTKSMMVSPQDNRFAEIEDLWDKVFADRDCIEPDEPEMWKTYVRYIEDPISALFDLGLAIFTIDEKRDFILPRTPDIQPLKPYIDDWKIRHHVLVPRYGCYQHSGGRLHRFDAQCKDGATEFLNGLRRRTESVRIYHNGLEASLGPGGESSISWCEVCFPAAHDGFHVTHEYISAVTGLPLEKLHQIYAEITGDDSLLGLS